MAFWIYADRDVVIKGSGSRFSSYSGFVYEVTWDTNLKKGWNIVYAHGTTVAEMRNRLSWITQKPDDVNLRWVFESWDFEDCSSRSITPRVTENRKSLFRQ